MDSMMFKSVSELAGLVRARHASPAELVEAALRRIEALDPSLGAFLEVDGDGAMDAAARLRPGESQPFAGVPIAIKANTAVAGLQTDHGSRLLAGHRPEHSAYLVRRLRDAGFIVIGTTKLPEFGILPTTEPRHGGPARNPWDPERTPGGCSGGSAAAVASGMVAIAHGNDGGGSIRIPAACCGLVGLKPSRGRISKGPDAGEAFLGVEGVLTRTVTDTAVALDVLAGYEVGDATWAPRPAEPYAVAVRRDPGRLRVGVTTSNPLQAAVDPECASGLHEAAQLLAHLGHHVSEVDPPLPGPEVLGLFVSVFGAERALDIAHAQRIAGHESGDEEIEPLSRALYDMAAGMSAIDLMSGVAQLQALARNVVALFADFDVLVTPALAERPLPIGECHGWAEDPLEAIGRGGAFTPYTALFNVTGQPAINVPIGFGADGLPTCIQIAGPPLAEETLLQLAAQIEAARGWAARWPELATSSGVAL